MRKIVNPLSEQPTGYGRENEVRETHPAFGVAVVSRVHGTARTVFQSDILHNDTITLSIQTADRTRSLARDWVHPRKTLVEVEMSLAQWGSLVSSMGIGSGTPVTIRSTESDYNVPGLPDRPRIAQSLAEVKGAVGKLVAHIRETFEDVNTAIEEKKGVKATREALNTHRYAIQNAEANATFAVKSMKEAAEKVTEQAKADIEAHILTTTALTGSTPIALPFATNVIAIEESE